MYSRNCLIQVFPRQVSVMIVTSVQMERTMEYHAVCRVFILYVIRVRECSLFDCANIMYKHKIKCTTKKNLIK